MPLTDNLGVVILPTDTVMVTAWGDGARLYDTGTKSAVVRLNRRRVVITDRDGYERAVTTSEVQVLRRDGEVGFEGNRR